MKNFLRRAGGIDQYPQVQIEWKLHHKPELKARDVATGKAVKVDLSPYKYDELHALFSKHFAREAVKPPNLAVRTWRRLFGWAYGISTGEAALMFVAASGVLLFVSYFVCGHYTALCDSIQDL